MEFCYLESLSIIIGGGSPLGSYLRNVILSDQLTFGFDNTNDIQFDLNDKKSWIKILDCLNLLEYSNVFIYFIGYTTHSSFKNEYPEIIFLRWLTANIRSNINIFIILTSTTAVYSNKISSYVEESSLIEPSTPYGHMKFLLENEVSSLINKNIIFSALILRIPCLVGPNAKHNFLSKIRTNILSGLDISLNNLESQFNSVTDFSEVNYVINRWKLNLKKNHVTVYNLAGSGSCTLKEFFSEIGINVSARIDEWPIPPRIILIKKIISDGYIISDSKTILRNFFK